MTIQGFTIQDKHGRAIAFVCQNDVVMRAGLDHDAGLKCAVSRLTGKPIREAQFDRKPGRSRVIRCFKCNVHFTPEQKIETRFGVPYYDAGWRPFHAECLEMLAGYSPRA
jgi:hypothetical protein